MERGSVVDAQETLESCRALRWVKCNNNGEFRFVTKVINSNYFEDDGVISGQPPAMCSFRFYRFLGFHDMGDLHRFRRHTDINYGVYVKSLQQYLP